MSEQKKKTVCFVCTANICRSPFGEYFLRHRLKEEAMEDYAVLSAGVSAANGNRLPHELIEIGQEFDVDLSPHKSQPLSAEIMDECDYILGMEKFHVEEVELRHPKTRGRAHMLRNFALQGSKTRDIADPFGLSGDFVRATYDDIAEAVEGFLKRLKEP